MTKYTKDDYFAAASTWDLWMWNIDTRVDSACRICGADEQVFWDIFRVSRKLEDVPDEILIQIGCELAGL